MGEDGNIMEEHDVLIDHSGDTPDPESPKTFTLEQVQELVREAQANQQRWIYLDLGFRECLNHLRPLCTPSKEYPLPAFDRQVYDEIDALFTRVREQYLGSGPANETGQD